MSCWERKPASLWGHSGLFVRGKLPRVLGAFCGVFAIQEFKLSNTPSKTNVSFWQGVVDGRNPAKQLIGSLSHYFQGFLHPMWYRMSFYKQYGPSFVQVGPFSLRFGLHHLGLNKHLCQNFFLLAKQRHPTPKVAPRNCSRFTATASGVI